MSYILDALRKSDQQRQRGAKPTLLTAQSTAAETAPPAYFIYGLLAAVLVGAGIVIGWLHRSQLERPAAETIAAKPLESSARQTAPASVTPVTPARPAHSLSNAGTRGTPPKAVTAATNDAPTIAAGATASYTEDAAAFALDPTLTLSDPELTFLDDWGNATLTVICPLVLEAKASALSARQKVTPP